MEYTVNKLSKLSGVSPRTLRYYDQIGLLKPLRVLESGYRVYGGEQVDALQQILFYRELGVGLEAIAELMERGEGERLAALSKHLNELGREKARIEALMENVEKTIKALKGEGTMNDKEKFEGFKKEKLRENEEKYGVEIRKKYGEEAVAASNAKLADMTEPQWKNQEELSAEISRLLGEAVAGGDPACESAQRACELHRQWLCMFWKSGAYSKEAHRMLGESYAADERFKAYYDAIAPGCAEFFRDTLNIYCK